MRTLVGWLGVILWGSAKCGMGGMGEVDHFMEIYKMNALGKKPEPP